ncbi:MAG: TetR/AcrR family transcriptional regulator [Moraxella osloensis]
MPKPTFTPLPSPTGTSIESSLSDFGQQAHIMGNANTVVRRSLAIALLKFMESTPFADISVTELTQKAGVSRMGYYRNYDSKLALLKDYLAQIEDDFPFIDLTAASEGEFYAFLRQVFDYLSKFELSTKILLNQGFEGLILDTLLNSKIFVEYRKKQALTCQATTALQDKSREYNLVFASGMLYHTYIHWVRQGQTETPQQLASWLMAGGFYRLFHPTDD